MAIDQIARLEARLPASGYALLKRAAELKRALATHAMLVEMQ